MTDKIEIKIWWVLLRWMQAVGDDKPDQARMVMHMLLHLSNGDVGQVIDGIHLFMRDVVDEDVLDKKQATIPLTMPAAAGDFAAVTDADLADVAALTDDPDADDDLKVSDRQFDDPMLDDDDDDDDDDDPILAALLAAAEDDGLADPR